MGGGDYFLEYNIHTVCLWGGIDRYNKSKYRLRINKDVSPYSHTAVADYKPLFETVLSKEGAIQEANQLC